MKKQTLIIAVSLLVAVLVAVYYFMLNELDYGKLADEFFAPYPNELTSNARSEVKDTTEQNLKKLMTAYEQKNYDLALKGFNEYLQTKPYKYEVKFYRGIIHLKNETPDLAVTDLEDVAVLNNSYKDPAEWYLGLAYLKNNQKKKAADLFFKIADSKSKYSEKANTILNKIPYKPHLKKEIDNI